MNTRWEEDSIGRMELQSDCLYGIRTARCIENTTFSGSRLVDYPGLIDALAKVKIACARANAATGVITPETADLIRTACESITSGMHHDAFVADMLHGGGYIAFNVNANEVIANLANLTKHKPLGSYAPVHPSTHVNACQSTADVCYTAVRLALLDKSAGLIKEMDQLERALTAKSVELNDVETVARTCLQDAMPTTLGKFFGAAASFVKRRLELYQQSLAELNRVNLGGTVIGSGAGADESYRQLVIDELIETTGRPALALRGNLFDAAQHMDDLAMLSAQLRLLCDGLIKLCKDIRLLSSGPNCGFGELVLPPVQEGSSFFKGKINPVVPETLIQACMQVYGCDRAVQAAAEHGELNLNVFEGVAAKNLLDIHSFLPQAIRLFRERCLQGLKANIDVCASHAANVPAPPVVPRAVATTVV